MSAIANVANAVGRAANGVADKKSNEIQVDDFMTIMIKELQQQDPFEPMSSKDLLNQIGQMQNIKSAIDLQDTLEKLAGGQKLAAAGNLMGKLVLGLDADGERVSGLVTAIKLEGDGVFLELDSGERVEIDDVLEVSNGAATDENSN